MFEFTSRTMRIGAFAASLTTLLWSGPPAIYADEVAGQVTASIDSKLGGSIADGEHLRVGEDAGCSVLLDDDAVVELCGQTSVVFDRDRDSNRRIVSVNSGEIRIVVEPRNFEERIEIHTPAAIATLLGTIVHVSVDAETGVTTISSAESKVSVHSDELDVRGTTVLAAGDQVTVQPGEAPPATPKRLDAQEVSELGGCLVDFHVAAADRDSRESGERAMDRLTVVDAVNAGSLPLTPPPDQLRGTSGDGPGVPLDGQEGVCVATDCGSDFEPHTDRGSPGSDQGAVPDNLDVTF